MTWLIRRRVLGVSILSVLAVSCDPKAEGDRRVSEQEIQKAAEKAIGDKLPQHVFLEERVRAISQQFERVSARLEQVSDELVTLKQRCEDLARQNEALTRKNDSLDQALRLLMAQAAEAATTVPEPDEGAEAQR